MSDAPNRTGLPPRYWETTPLDRMTRQEWEALCDGCGKCCLNKIEDADTGEISLTRVACRMLDDSTCRCSNYRDRRKYVPDCVVLTPGNIKRHLGWLPKTCAYRLVHEGQPLRDWHPLVSGNEESVHEAGVSLRGATVSERAVSEDAWENHVIEEPC